MTREEARRRRKRIATAVREHHDPRRAASDFGVSVPLVRRACWEFGVRYPTRELNRNQIISDLRVGKSVAEIAEREKVSQARIERMQEEGAQGKAGS